VEEVVGVLDPYLMDLPVVLEAVPVAVKVEDQLQIQEQEILHQFLHHKEIQVEQQLQLILLELVAVVEELVVLAEMDPLHLLRLVRVEQGFK
jgi:sensor domain CHASE-containing protein